MAVANLAELRTEVHFADHAVRHLSAIHVVCSPRQSVLKDGYLLPAVEGSPGLSLYARNQGDRERQVRSLTLSKRHGSQRVPRGHELTCHDLGNVG